MKRDADLYNEFQDAVKEGLPDCLESGSDIPCPLKEVEARLAAGSNVEDHELALAESECNGCFWSSDEYRTMTTYGPAFTFALDWLRRREINLEAKDLTAKEEQIILFANSEIETGKSRRMEIKPSKDK